MTLGKRYWHQRIGRRRALQSAAIGSMGLAATTLIACGGTSTTPEVVSTSSQATQPKRGGTLLRQSGLETQGYDFDPQTQTPLKGQIYRIMYQGLIGPNPETYDLEPELAQKWEQPSQTEYLLRLNPGVKFHNKPPANGREMTIDDVIFSLNRARTNNPTFTSGSLLSTIDKMAAVDRQTLRITTKDPDAPFLAKLSGDQFMIMAPEVVEKAGKFSEVETAVGTGAFMLVARTDDVGAEYVRNPDYWKVGLPYLDGVKTRHFGDPGDDRAWATFLAGQLDAAVAPGKEAKGYIAKQGAGYVPRWNKEVATNLLQPNVKVKPFDDVRVTKAMRLLIDHDEFKTSWAEVWFGRGRYGSIFPGALEPWDLPEEEYAKYLEWKQPKDNAVKEALALLAAAGFTKENPLKTEMFGASTIFAKAGTELLQAQYRRLAQGVVETQLRIPDSAGFQKIRTERSFEFGMFTNQASLAEPDSWLSQAYKTDASRNYWGWSDPKMDALIERQRVTFDVNQRKAIVKEAIIYAIENAPGSLISHRLFLTATKPFVQNFYPEFYPIGRQYEQVWFDL